MKKPVKVILIIAVIAAVALTALTWGWVLGDIDPVGGDSNAVEFVNNCAEIAIYCVSVDSRIGDGGSQHADGTPLDQEETLYFAMSDGEMMYLEYPLTVAVYSGLDMEGELASYTISEAPPEGEYWSVTAEDGVGGPRLTAMTKAENKDTLIMERILWLADSLLLLLFGMVLPYTALIALWAIALVQLPRERRRGLLPVGVLVFAAAGILFGGNWLLGQFGLTWRNPMAWFLGWALWLLGLAASVLTCRDTLRWTKEVRPKLADWGLVLSILCTVLAMISGTVLGGLWLMDWPGEKVGEYEGRTVIQTAFWEWEAPYNLYEYRGPFVREVEPFTWSEKPFFPEEPQLYGADRDLGLDLSAGEIVESYDDHGWMGDGETYVVVRFSDDALEKQLTDWKPLPLTEELRQVRTEAIYSFGDDIPEDGEGWYWFRDDQNKDDPTDGSQVFSDERHSFNYALAVYDRATRTLYYYELDT